MDLNFLDTCEDVDFAQRVKNIIESNEYCNKAGYDVHGSCCCNCKWQTVITKHPWNKQEQFKGSVMEIIGFGCTPPDLYPNTTFFEKSHGMCECHSR